MLNEVTYPWIANAKARNLIWNIDLENCSNITLCEHWTFHLGIQCFDVSCNHDAPLRVWSLDRYCQMEGMGDTGCRQDLIRDIVSEQKDIRTMVVRIPNSCSARWRKGC